MEIFQARILKWVTMPFSRGIYPTQGSNVGLCITDGFFIAEPPRKLGRLWGSRKMKRKMKGWGNKEVEREREGRPEEENGEKGGIEGRGRSKLLY